MNERHFRKWDIAYIAGFLLLCGTVYKLATHPMQWDENTDKIDKLIPRVGQTESDIKEIRSVNQTQMTMIVRELDGIHKEVTSIRRSANVADR